jgi:glycosyltransferase involved in cell wall biosynthesis
MTLARQFLRRGFRVDVVTCQDIPEPKLAIPATARYVVLGAKRIRDFVLPFARYLRRERPDAVVVSMWPLTTASLLAHWLARSTSRIVVCERSTISIQYADRGLLHGLMLKETIAASYPLAHARIAVSHGVADDLVALSGIARDRFTVVHNPMTLPLSFDCDGSAAEAAWEGWRGPRIITVGRLAPEKNHDLLIGAFKQLLTVQDARLMIVGAGQLGEATAATARAEGVAEKVLMPGATLDPTPYYRSADLFVLSSNREGFGNVIVEALACGLPVVSTNCKSGPSEILANGRYGRLVPVNDQIALAHAMAEALSAEHNHLELKRRAADFAPEIIAEQYLRILFPQWRRDSAAPSEK